MYIYKSIPTVGALFCPKFLRRIKMAKWIVIFLVVALVAVTVGFDGVARATAANIQLLYVVCMIVTGVTLIRRTKRHPNEPNF